MKILVVDDEPLARVRMRKLLSAAREDIEIDESDCADAALNKIRNGKPFAVFLDIQMPGKGGFELIEDLAQEEEKPFVIFVTAFDNYAIKAFEKNAIDYLLKPVEQERLLRSLEKLEFLQTSQKMEDSSNSDFYDKIRELVANMPENAGSANARNSTAFLQRLQVKIGDRTLLVPISDIVRFESDEKYTAVYTADSRYIIDTPIVDLEEKLNPSEFVRIHRANLVAVNRIAEIRRSFPGKLSVVLNDSAKTVLPVGRNYIDRVRGL